MWLFVFHDLCLEFHVLIDARDRYMIGGIMQKSSLYLWSELGETKTKAFCHASKFCFDALWKNKILADYWESPQWNHGDVMVTPEDRHGSCYFLDGLSSRGLYSVFSHN